jgi:hypothetical protein
VSTPVEHADVADGATPKAALVFMIFLAAGPPLGSLLLWFIVIIAGPIPLPSSLHEVSVHLRMIGLFAVASYIFGGLQALFVATVAAVFQSLSRLGLVPVRPVLIACLLASAVYPVFLFVKDHNPPPWSFVLASVALHVGSGLLCCLICNTVLWPFRRRSGNQVAA